MKRFIFSYLLVLLSFGAFADGAFLDAPYKIKQRPVVDDVSTQKQKGPQFEDNLGENPDLSRNRVLDVIGFQTEVKSQMNRGTCSIFSATALLESLLVRDHGFLKSEMDLSEEWLEYLVVRNSTSDGSGSYWNFNAMKKHGMPYEVTMPYIGDSWEKDKFLPPLAVERCGHIAEESDKYISCLLVHRDPDLLYKSTKDLFDPKSKYYDEEFGVARKEAREFRNSYISYDESNSSSWSPYTVYSTSQIKKYLREKTPMTLGIDFYYGAWNHRLATGMGMERDLVAWESGVVAFPEVGTIDRRESAKEENQAGHSIVIVGYDNDIEITSKQEMEDGTVKEFTERGVYFFKNSWGTSSFGVNAKISGFNFPGYGIISQKYAHRYGTFYRLPLKK